MVDLAGLVSCCPFGWTRRSGAFVIGCREQCWTLRRFLMTPLLSAAEPCFLPSPACVSQLLSSLPMPLGYLPCISICGHEDICTFGKSETYLV